MATYFGACDSAGNPTGSSSDSNSAAFAFYNDGTEAAFTCPGTGNQVVHMSSGSGIVIRLAIYNAAGTTKIAEGTADVTVTGATDSWQGHLTQASISPNPCTLVGGTKYRLVGANNAGGGTIATDHYVVNDGFKVVDYTGGNFPATLPSYDGSGFLWPVRAGVDPAPPDVVPFFGTQGPTPTQRQFGILIT
jgi:hypothetical protein